MSLDVEFLARRGVTNRAALWALAFHEYGSARNELGDYAKAAVQPPVLRALWDRLDAAERASVQVFDPAGTMAGLP